MDRARRNGSSGLGRWGGDLKPRLLLIVLFAACTVITGDLGRTVAIAIEGESTKQVEEDDTITLLARAIDAAGDTVSDAIVVWELLNADGAFDLDSITGVVHARHPGRGRVRARVEELRSDTISIRVTGAADSIAAVGDTVVTMTADEDASPHLSTILIDLTTDTALIEPLSERDVTYTLAHPAPGTISAQGFFLTVSDSLPGSEPHSVVAKTDGASTAFVVVRQAGGGSLPDSAFIDAVAVTAVGDTVAGSPVRFIVVFDGGT